MDPFNEYPVPDDFWTHSWYDAHCHPTDTPSTLSSIPSMKAAKLNVMSTRFSDQSYVKKAAADYPDRIVPAFGLHPWFSHLLYDDQNPELKDVEMGELKRRHYMACLQPAPDESFIRGLPDPKPLGKFLDELRQNLRDHPHAPVGEVGMDKSFRIPVNWDQTGMEEPQGDTPPGGRADRKLSPHRVSSAQQKLVLQSQLRVAGEFDRAASVHSVKSHGAIFDCLRELWKGWEIRVESNREKRLRSKAGVGFIPEYDSDDSDWNEEEDSDDEDKFPEQPKQGVRPYPPRILIHSCSAPEVAVKQFLGRPNSTHVYPSELFFSFSTTINCKHMDHLEAVIKTVAENTILMESDLHTAGDMMDAALSQAAILICKTRGWTIEEGAEIMEKNWKRYIYGGKLKKSSIG